MINLDTDALTITDVGHLPIVKHYAKKIRLVETIDAMVQNQMQVSAGMTVLAMVLDTLSGRNPLYRLQSFFEDKDTELLLGEALDPASFADHNVSRVLDSLYDAGTGRIFSQIAQNAIGAFALDTACAHYDTTSMSVFGDYDQPDAPFHITYGHSKDKRPDLKQFLVEMFCVDRDVPIIGATRDGNASDKTLNNELLGGICRHMARHGIDPSAFIYVADSALITHDNLKRAEENGIHFLSRLPATFNECARAIDQAVAGDADQWTDVGALAQTPATGKRPAARYRVFETPVTLYGTAYRAIVVHSSAHDKRRHKRIERLLEQKRSLLAATVKDATGGEFFCRADALQAAEQLEAHARGSYHRIQTEVVELPKFGRGRPAKDRQRTPVGYRYQIKARIAADDEAIAPLKLGAGCFVLLSNVPSEFQGRQWTAADLLAQYKEQFGIEKNFGFLKDPLIVNSIFLKKNERIEVLGMVLLIALLIWRLMERTMRRHIEEKDRTIPGWDKRQTTRPTAFMMTTKFTNTLVLTVEGQRRLARPLKAEQKEFLAALEVSHDIFTVP
jgi:transposase